MKLRLLLPLLLLPFCSLFAQSVPTLISHQGRLLDNGGTPVSGNVAIVVEIYTNATIGTAIYTEDLGQVPVNNGIFSIQFGSDAAGIAAAMAHPEAWLSVSVDGLPLDPRQRLIAVPYALAAGTVRGEHLSVDPASGRVDVRHDTLDIPFRVGTFSDTKDNYVLLRTAGGSAYRSGLRFRVFSDGYGFNIENDDRPGTTGLNFLRVRAGQPELEKSVLFLDRNAESVGIGTTSPGEKLHVDGAVTIGDAASASPPAGTIRWSGSAFEGYDGNQWVLLSPVPTPTPLVSPEMVPVGHIGNDDDPESNGLGAVAYPYSIGKYEVTNSEYCTFLNAVDPTGANALVLYIDEMSSTTHGGITLTAGNPDGNKYTVKAGSNPAGFPYDDLPVVYVNVYDMMRYCNWLHNGAQAGSDTETGAYTLLGGTAPPSNGTTVERNPGARYTLPTYDEWYKAAYYQPAEWGGDTDNYWLYPTGSNDPPNAEIPPGTAPAANYNSGVGYMTPVGSYSNTAGYYGTYDMAGNAAEQLETRTSPTTERLRRGTSIWGIGDWMRADHAPPGSVLDPSGFKGTVIGFRLSSPAQ